MKTDLSYYTVFTSEEEGAVGRRRGGGGRGRDQDKKDKFLQPEVAAGVRERSVDQMTT